MHTRLQDLDYLSVGAVSLRIDEAMGVNQEPCLQDKEQEHRPGSPLTAITGVPSAQLMSFFLASGRVAAYFM